MAKFSDESKRKLSTCDARLQMLFNKVIENFDCKILEGHRGKEEQDMAFKTGNSKVMFPNSKHNKMPSRAVDVVPYPVVWTDLNRLYMFAGYVRGVADSIGVKIRIGADWNGNGEIKDQNFHDLPHFELQDEV